jgi:hypothetical protein
MNGALDEVAVWDRAVSAAEIRAVYQGGLKGMELTSIADPLRLTLQINQDNGEIILTNNSTSSQAIRGYSILSDGETLNPANWTSITDGGDANSGGSVDSDDNWVEFTNPNSHGDLSEGSLGEGALGPGQSFSLGVGSWSKFYQQDLRFEYINGSGDVLTDGFIEYIGNGGQPYAFADLDFDGDVDGLDWEQYVAGLGKSFPDASIAEAYIEGDLTGDLQNNHDDFLAFRAAFDAANGAGAFDRMIVPEPSSLLLLGFGLVAFGRCLRRRQDG